jgi:hypothetical protein
MPATLMVLSMGILGLGMASLVLTAASEIKLAKVIMKMAVDGMIVIGTLMLIYGAFGVTK